MALFQKTDPKTAAHLLTPSLPGRQKLNELVCLLIWVSSCVHIFHLLGHLWEVPTAASQTDAGWSGAGAEPWVWHRGWLVLSQEVEATWWETKSRWNVQGRHWMRSGGVHQEVCSYLHFLEKKKNTWFLTMAMTKQDWNSFFAYGIVAVPCKPVWFGNRWCSAIFYFVVFFPPFSPPRYHLLFIRLVKTNKFSNSRCATHTLEYCRFKLVQQSWRTICNINKKNLKTSIFCLTQ